MRNINLKIDINKQNYIYEDAMQNDDIALQITLFENGIPYNLGTNTVTLNWLKADGTFVLINTTKEISITNNVVNIILPRDCTRAIGVANFELSIMDTNNKQVSTFPLSIEVIGSVLSGNKEPSKNLITSIEELENAIKTNLENATATADAKKTELDTSIANAQDDINTINSAGNRTFTIPSTAWVGTEPNLSYILEHNLGGENLIVGVIDNDTKLSSMPDYKSIDGMKIELYSTTRRNVTVTINKSAYTGSDSEWVSQEVIDARGGEVSLKSKIDGIDTNIGEINTSVNALNTEIITARGSDLTLDERLDGIDTQLVEVPNQYYSQTFPTVNDVENMKNGDLWFILAPEFLPTEISNLSLWLDASKITGVDGGTIQQWNDLSGNNNHAIQMNLANKPLLKTGVLNGFPVVRFDGIDDYLTIASQTYGNELSIFIVSKINQAKESYIYDGGYNSSGSFLLMTSATAGQIQFATYSTGIMSTSFDCYVNDKFRLLDIVRKSNTDITLNENGSKLETLNTSSVTISSDVKNHNIGFATQRNKAGTYADMDVAEIIIYKKALTDSERMKVQNYLLLKYYSGGVS